MAARRAHCASVAAIADLALPAAVSFATASAISRSWASMPATRRACSAMRASRIPHRPPARRQKGRDHKLRRLEQLAQDRDRLRLGRDQLDQPADAEVRGRPGQDDGCCVGHDTMAP
jgi:hypothetical protein